MKFPLARLPLVSAASSCLPAVSGKLSQGRGNSASSRLPYVPAFGFRLFFFCGLFFWWRIKTCPEKKLSSFLIKRIPEHTTPSRSPSRLSACVQLYESILIPTPVSQLAERAELDNQNFCTNPLFGTWSSFKSPILELVKDVCLAVLHLGHCWVYNVNRMVAN